MKNIKINKSETADTRTCDWSKVTKEQLLTASILMEEIRVECAQSYPNIIFTLTNALEAQKEKVKRLVIAARAVRKWIKKMGFLTPAIELFLVALAAYDGEFKEGKKG